MRLDSVLCATYLDMPAPHWRMAQASLDWLEGDRIGSIFLSAALQAFARGDSYAARESCCGVKEYALRACPERAEGVVPAVFAAALPGAIERMRDENISEAIIRDTLIDYGIWARAYEKANGFAGFGEIGWEAHFLAGRIVKIGRLQYERNIYEAPYTIYRDRETDELLPVPHAGLEIDERGCLAQGAPAAFTTIQERKDGTLRFQAVDTQGARVKRETVSRPLPALEPVVMTGMPVLNMHIPECGPLKPEEITASLQNAHAFFETRGIENRVGVCESWLLDPALLTYGAGCENICGFQKRFTKYPECTRFSDSVTRVYGRGTDRENIEAFSEGTRLQRGLKAYMRAGGFLRDAGGVLYLK